jgi:hypothetical protein
VRPVGRTRQKLDEATYFLQRVEEHYFDALEDDGRPLIYYISAFVSAARSVTWIMKSEYGGGDGWKAWYDARRPGAEDVALLRKFTDARNRSQKIAPLQVGIRLYASPEGDRSSHRSDDSAPNPKLQRYRITIQEVDPPSGHPRSMEAVLDSIECSVSELGEEDLLRACRRYLELLTRLVRECEARFDTTPA